jgi:hypothetical protein
MKTADSALLRCRLYRWHWGVPQCSIAMSVTGGVTMSQSLRSLPDRPAESSIEIRSNYIDLISSIDSIKILSIEKFQSLGIFLV